MVLRFTINNDEEARAIDKAADTLYLDVWDTNDKWADIRIAQDVIEPFLGLLPASLRASHKPLMHDLAQAVADNYPSTSGQDPTQHRGFTPSLRVAEAGDHELFFREYQPLSVMVPWMKLMQSLFPSHTRLISIGKSYEGRDILGLRVGVHPTNGEDEAEPRQTIIISGGSHAREWISASSVNYVAYSLITRYGKYSAITKFLTHFDIVFIPTLNPDGYAYTWEQDRLWRKNRQDTDFQYCPGVDLDRAFGFEWDGESTRSNPCSESYAGDYAFDGVEAKAFADWAKNETSAGNSTFVAFIDLHSYSQQVLYPYAYSCAAVPPSLENLEELAMILAKALRVTNGHAYGVSSACEGSITLAATRSRGDKVVVPKTELTGGSALDWFYHELGVKWSYQIKLRDQGSYGFLLPKHNIVPTGQETFNAVLALGKFLLSNKGIEKVDFAHEIFRPRKTASGLWANADAVDHEDEFEVHSDDDKDYDEDYDFEMRRRK